MKKQLYIKLAVCAGLAGALTVSAQTNTNSPPPPPDTSTINVRAAARPMTNMPATAIIAPATGTNDTATAAAAVANLVATPAVGIPNIQFANVPLTTAIENLARLAGINYMLDPKIGYGQPDANGKIKVEPILSIRWENISAQNALLALLDNYDLQLIEDNNTGIARITMKDPTAPPPLFTKVIQLKYAGVSNIVDSVRSILMDKRSKVLADQRTSQLVVVATDPELLTVETLINKLDKPTRQVLIETHLIQISSSPETQKGIDWSGTLQAHTIQFGNSTSDGTATGTPTFGVAYDTAAGFTPALGYLSSAGFSAVLSFLNNSADAQVMSVPRVVTLDNEESTISVTRTYPIFNVTAGTSQTTGGSSVTYSNIGTILKVTPRISANDYIWLKVAPEVSSFYENFSEVTGGGTGGAAQTLTAPVFDYRNIDTQVLIPNANTLVMGGLVQDDPSDTYTKVPLLGSIPWVGRLFSSEDKKTDKENLLIFITPTILTDSDFQTHPASGFLQSKPPSLKDQIDPTSVWDNPSPDGSWSDPITDTTK